MSETSLDKAIDAQIAAANPSTDAWISANAGSGKTRVLTNRVARLLYHGAEPQHILCLTYTNAAAGEMQNRLFDQLGKWVMLDDELLSQALIEMGEPKETLDAGKLLQARRLFAQALETPGGLKIQTIHSFCDGVLRRFALEAKVNPSFDLLDDQAAKILRNQVVEQLAQQNPFEFGEVCTSLTDGDLDKLIKDVIAFQNSFDKPPEPKALGVNEERLAKVTIDLATHDALPRILEILQTGNKTELGKAPELKSALGFVDLEQRAEGLKSVFLTKSSPMRPNTRIPSQKSLKDNPSLVEVIQTIHDALVERNELVAARNAFHRSNVLHRFSELFLPAYREEKEKRGLLDYDDLIQKTCTLLEKSEMAQWVLYRLDGGIEHILVDEAQDTSPLQWRVIDRIRSEFHAGIGQFGKQRTLFVVGDEKQSIYSFQGADADLFEAKRMKLREELNAQEVQLTETPLEFSFRSAPPILRLVDEIFHGPAGQNVQKKSLHRSPDPNKYGHIEIWPFVEKVKSSQEQEWYLPLGGEITQRHERTLALKIAEYLERRIQSREIEARDVMILFRTRGTLFLEVLKALKERSLPVAGADRLVLNDHIAVKDILSVLRFSIQPDDNLSLAEALRSPIFGLSEAQLYRLATSENHDRLYKSLKVSEHIEAIETLKDIRAHAGILRPYELIERILIQHKGRENLRARLGMEVDDAIQALLDEALRYESIAPPNLTGFVSWLDSSHVEVKRQDSDNLNQIKLMTIHGAKGLERPIVILPDTHKKMNTGKNQAKLALGLGQLIWRSSKDEAGGFQLKLDEQRQEKELAEEMRLLYVALTRAEHELIVVGAGTKDKQEFDWYSLISNAALSIGAKNLDGNLIISSGQRQPRADMDQAQIKVEMPELFKNPILALRSRSQPISPSQLSGAKTLSSETEADADAAIRGTFLHRLLEILAANQHLNDQQIFARLHQEFPELSNAKDIFDKAKRIIAKFASIFDEASLGEVSIAAPIAFANGVKIRGEIDRLIVNEMKVVAIDFKSNRTVPNKPSEIPEGILAQMGAYLCGLDQCFPEHEIELAVLWSETEQYMSIPHNLASEAFKAALDA